MQLNQPQPKRPVRDVLQAAALALLVAPAAAKAQDAAASTNQIDVTSLLYSEQSRTSVVEPVVRFAHITPDGQRFYGELGIDVITGASATGALPSGIVQTRTSASGRTITSPAGAIPTAPFQDHRIALTGGWTKPITRFITTDINGHFSREKDYQSLGFDGKISTDVWRRLFTLTLGGGVNHDSVFPVGGTPIGLSLGNVVSHAANPKTVSNVFAGVSHVMSRRWILSVDASRTHENGYLTEPYKLVTVMNATTGAPVLALTDKRPSTRDRTAAQISSVYHLSQDVIYSSYRYYTDSWQVRSHTLDLKYRHDLSDTSYLEPLVRVYTQSRASFYTAGLVEGNPLPDYATSDYRLGALQTLTLGATWGFQPDFSVGTWTVRGEYIRQAGDSSPPGVVGIQRRFDLAPPLNIFAIVVGYSFNY